MACKRSAVRSRLAPPSLKDGRLAQLGEHLPYKEGVTGSSPVSPTIFSIEKTVTGAIAQLGERLPCTQEVSSSILLSSTISLYVFRQQLSPVATTSV